MSRLIDADKLLEPVGSYDPKKDTWEYGVVVTVEDIKNAPTVDAIEVVRCKECKWFRDAYFISCELTDTPMTPESFCSRGERKTE